jgi:hypothetical protein
MNLIDLKKKYDKIYKIIIDKIEFYYRSFNAHEMIILMKPGGEEKYKYDITREAIINKEVFDSIKENWAVKEQLYNCILSKSNLGTENEIIDKKLLIKNEFNTNPFYIMISRILSAFPTIPLHELLNYNADQLLFYIVLIEEVEKMSRPQNVPQSTIPNIPVARKKMEFSQQDLNNIAMETSNEKLRIELEKAKNKVKK